MKLSMLLDVKRDFAKTGEFVSGLFLSECNFTKSYVKRYTKMKCKVAISSDLVMQVTNNVSQYYSDEVGVLPMIPKANELPPKSQSYYPLVVIETKLGISKHNLATLLKEAHQHYITLSKDNHIELEHVTRAMILLKPDNYTAMNRR